MPVIIDRLAADTWLDPVVSHPGTLSIYLQPLPSELMEFYEVPRLVNDPRNDSPACIEPFAMPPAQSSDNSD
jgi:putative SOS response-associated peptidase YedK